MIARLIRWSATNLVLVSIACAFAVAAGLYAVRHVPLDAIPDLSDTQVIVYTEYSGSGAAGHRGSGHLSAVDGHADGAEIQGRAWLLVLRRLVRLRHLRGRHRHLLGPLARARVSLSRRAVACPQALRRRSGRTRPVSAGSINTSSRRAKRTLAELRSTQDWQVRFAPRQGGRRVRGRERRRLRAPVLRRGRSAPPQGASTSR